VPILDDRHPPLPQLGPVHGDQAGDNLVGFLARIRRHPVLIPCDFGITTARVEVVGVLFGERADAKALSGNGGKHRAIQSRTEATEAILCDVVDCHLARAATPVLASCIRDLSRRRV